LDVQTKLGSKLEDRMGCNMRRDIFVSFLLVTNVDEAVVNAHFKFGWRFVATTLIFVEFF
jgi:hypothetical protein